MMRWILAAAALVVPALTVTAGEAPGPVDTDMGPRIERAVVAGSVKQLDGLLGTLEAAAESSSWHYERAYIHWRISQLLPAKGAKKEKKRRLKEAQRLVDLLIAEEPANAEAHALRGSVIGGRISGMLSGMTLGSKASTSLERAYELEPDNPRVALQRGISFLFTPKTFGGGQAKAELELRRACALFDKESAPAPDDPAGGAATRVPVKPWPNWGHVDALAWLGQSLVKAGRQDEARAAYLAALELEPSHTWVRDVLLPEVQSP